MVLTRKPFPTKLVLASAVFALATGLSACKKPAEPTTGEPGAAQQMGNEAGQVQQSTSDVLNGASDKLDSAADKAQDAADEAKQSAEDAKADFQKGYEEGKSQGANGK